MSEPFATALDFIDTARDVEETGLGLDHVAAIRRGETKEVVEFTFEYLGFIFAVRADTSQQQTRMSFRANLGSMPYTAEDPEARANALMVLRTASRVLGGRVRLTPRQRLILSDELRFDEPLTPISMMSRSARLLLRVKPYLELLTSYVRPPVEYETSVSEAP